jgi:hypothetical protein
MNHPSNTQRDGSVRHLLLVIALLMGCENDRSAVTLRGSPSPLFIAVRDASAFDAAFDQSVEAIMTLGWEIKFSERASGLLVGRVPGSLRSWSGQTVTLKIKRVPIGIQVDATSTSVGSQWHDENLHRRNVETVLSSIARRLHVAYAP